MNELNHLAIIMDGNGRWAKNQGLLRSFGHKAGAKTIERLVKACIEEGVLELSLFAFSTENWKRPKEEIEFIFKLLKEYLSSELNNFIKNEIRFKSFGDISVLDLDTKNLINEFEEKTKNYSRIIFNLGINYGGKNEILRAFKKLKASDEEIDENNFNKYLDIKNNVDLLIRTGGHFRISNFLLWQCAYAEFVFTPTLFPDFKEDELKEIIKNYRICKRNFGGV
ncbi:di-trans,poly-cis-decaprenylcistransferase [Campylobacter sp. RM12640]|uniref:polyprenyl diphosphate synthase n=1 Tax=unclassified Campylobacter TaxID=2593542 RepID=UPI00301489E6|nr:di-trans,poly-cis-decaprenylcistransferase [Campylobacter sp. RM12640]MBZ7988430.1 di-trans,poly-cis-decaprenylcistransferase [Campylobacter sp. RM12635]